MGEDQSNDQELRDHGYARGPFMTKSGRELSDADIEALSAEAERSTRIPAMSDRRWYIMLTDADGGMEGLLGPFKGGQEQAEQLQARMLATDQMITDGLDWDDPAAAAPVFYNGLRVVDLSAEEVFALGTEAGLSGEAQ